MSKEPTDKNGFSIKPPISDLECILVCLKNAPCGTDKKQVERIIKHHLALKESNLSLQYD